MALKDDNTLTPVTTDWMLLLTGVGSITNTEIGLEKNLEYRYDVVLPVGNVTSRTLFSLGNFANDVSNTKLNTFTNNHFDSMVYGRAKTGTVNVLITREV